MIEALLLDIDGVVIRPEQHWGTDLDQELGVSYETLSHEFFKPHWDEIVCGRAALAERLSQVLARIAPDLGPDRLLAYWFEHEAKLDRALLADVARLRRDGLRVWFATNQAHERAEYLMQTLGLCSHVDGCFYSAALGHQKPDPAFYRAVGQRIGLSGDRVMLVDDTADNVEAAQRAGWHAALWTGECSLFELIEGVSAAPA